MINMDNSKILINILELKYHKVPGKHAYRYYYLNGNMITSCGPKYRYIYKGNDFTGYSFIIMKIFTKTYYKIIKFKNGFLVEVREMISIPEVNPLAKVLYD